MEPKESSGRKHFIISMIKSGVRIIAGCSLIFGQIVTAGVLLVIAEILGIMEEM